MRRGTLRLLALVGWVSAACGGGGGSTGGGPAPSPNPSVQVFTGYRGVFALGKDGQDLPSGVFTNPSVDGVALRTTWANVEPSEGGFDFSQLDGQLTAANAARKSVSVSIAAGTGTPAWVYAAGAAAFTTIVDQKYAANFCQTVTLPIPWDGVFLQKWTAFVQALGQHYDSAEGISKVHLTGINFHTEETTLPTREGETVQGFHGSTCQTNNDVQEWLSVGYTGAKVMTAWNQIGDAFSAAFPRSKIAAMVHSASFPPINDAGQPDPQGAQLQAQLISAGISRYGAQFAAQNNGLSASYVDPQVAGVTATTTTGYQMLWFVTNDSTCRMNHGAQPCDPVQDLQGAVNAGVQAGGTYLEIYAVDILNPDLSNVIASAHAQLVP